jgi:glutamyl-tRNA synthetase
MTNAAKPYRGRIAPSPTGHLHMGHARTFWRAQSRARAANGVLVLRNDDLDRVRCKAQFIEAMREDLRWFGFVWQEGPDCGGPFGPYSQSERYPLYEAALNKLREKRLVYPCVCSRKDVQAAATAPHAMDDEIVYPGTCRPENLHSTLPASTPDARAHWRFRVPDGEAVAFVDGRLGAVQFVAGRDFGDFIVRRSDGVPSYQLACVVDDDAMRISEVVRGEDLLMSTARQLLLYRALDLQAPAFFHCPLLCDEQGQRIAKRHAALSLRTLRVAGNSPEALRRECEDMPDWKESRAS